MTDEISTDDLFGKDEPAKPEAAPEPPKEPKPKRAAKPKAAPKPKRAAEPTDTATEVRVIDWKCAECGNRNTHDLTRCGKCRTPRYTTD